MLDKDNLPARSRFAPSPSGFIHIGNARAAIMSYLYAKENNGSFILRIEDTDLTRTSKVYLDLIYYYLDWLGIKCDESPIIGGNYGPYIQSERKEIYDKYLNLFLEKNVLYKCFKTVEELEQVKERQKMLGLPPRYERDSCLISKEAEEKYLSEGRSYVWRFKVPSGITIAKDKVRGDVSYDLSNFSDFPITRQDGSYTFLFANFVDDVEMKMTCVIRGEEHISNTALQSAMYDILDIKKPLFYHLPLICDSNGKKLSKRDFGFSVQDLINDNYLPEAILNYLILIGSSFENEIFSIQEAIDKKFFSKIKSSGSICYDIKKLDWINKQWIKRLKLNDFIKIIENKLNKENKNLINVLKNQELMSDLQKESSSINDAIEYVSYFSKNNFIKCSNEIEYNYAKEISNFLKLNSKKINLDEFKEFMKGYANENSLQLKNLMQILRYILTGKYDGISLSILINHIDFEDFKNKLDNFIENFN